MRTEQLEYIAAVARLGSFRRAAEALHISQPALSESVRSLERELGLDILERGRHGARISHSGRDLLPRILTVLDSVDRLRQAAGELHANVRMIRVGTVNTATVPLVTPAIREFRETHQNTQVEIIGAQQADIHRAILEGSLDLGLINYLEGDDDPPDLESTRLLRGHPVVCMRPDSPLAARDTVRVSDLRSEPLIVMRAGYLMHRYVHRLLGDRLPVFSYSTDGAEMGKIMVAEGLGLTVLPDFSLAGDPLEQHGAITWRPLADDDTEVLLVIQRLRSGSPPRAVKDMHRIFVSHAKSFSGTNGKPGPARPVRQLPRMVNGAAQHGAGLVGINAIDSCLFMRDRHRTPAADAAAWVDDEGAPVFGPRRW